MADPDLTACSIHEADSRELETTRKLNLTDQHFEYDTYEDFVDARLTDFLNRCRLSEIEHSWSYVHDAKTIYEDGDFGRLLHVLDQLPPKSKWEQLKDAKCIRCEKPNSGIIGYSSTVQTPSGHLVSIHQQSELCSDCFSQVLDELEETGTPQPTLSRGRWWPKDAMNNTWVTLHG